MLSHLIHNLLCHGCRLIPLNGKIPRIPDWPMCASNNPLDLEGWRRQFGRYSGFGLCLTADMVVTDLDMKVGENGVGDFMRLDGRDPRDITTPTATSPTGGLHLYWATSGRRFKNIRIPGTSIDVKCIGGQVAVPDEIDGYGNGREWLPGQALWEIPPAPAPAWLNAALKREEETRSSAEAPDLPPSEYDQEFARAALVRACVRIVRAPNGEQDRTRNAECFFIGILVGRGTLDEAEALAALVRATKAMPVYRDPWRDLERRVRNSFKAGLRKAEATS
jgi:hypothetical protein